MIKLKLIISFFSLIISNCFGQSAKEIISKSLEVHGGITTWQNIKYIKSNRIGHSHWLEQSEHAKGPYLVGYEDVSETRSTKENKLVSDTKQRHFQFPEWQSTDYILNEEILALKKKDRMFPMPKQFQEEYEQWVMYAPEKHLMAAYEDVNLSVGETVEIHGISHFQLHYSIDEIPCILFLNKNTYLISAIEFEWNMPYNFFWDPWGTFKTRIQYNLYNLYPKGIRYPNQWDIYRKNLHFKSATFTSIDFFPEVNDSIFHIPQNTKELHSKRAATKIQDTPLDTSSIKTLAEGIYQIPNYWNIGWIEQQDGIIIIESPMSTGYSEKVIDLLSEKYPSKKIKAVICTSDAWPHVGGVKAYYENNIPIYGFHLSIPLLEALSGVKPQKKSSIKDNSSIRSVNKNITFDDEKIPFEVIPIKGEGGERYLLLYFPKQKVMYSSDLLFNKNKRTGKYFMPQYQSEIKMVVDRENLLVERVFGMHLKPIQWEEISTALEKTIYGK